MESNEQRITKSFQIHSVTDTHTDKCVFHDASQIDVSVYYDKGGEGWCGSRRRGYYLSIQPCKCGNGFYEIQAFTGVGFLLNCVARKSKAGFAEAVKDAEECVVKKLRDFCTNRGYKIDIPDKISFAE